MKPKIYLMTMIAALCLTAASASAGGLGDVRMNARFLTDRMAFELNLSPMQYEDLFEINFDFFSSIDRYMDDGVYANAYALDNYYRYLDERNDDIRWILSNAEFARFMALDYFFRPVYVTNGCCSLRIYARYPDPHFFYFSRPARYYTYRGMHSRSYCGGISYYQRHYAGRYSHPVFRGNIRSHADYRRHDFMPPRPSRNPGYHFEAVPRPRPDSHRPNRRPDMENHPQRPGYSRPLGSHRPAARPDTHRPSARPGTDRRPQYPEYSRPLGNYRPATRPEGSRPVINRPQRSESSRPGVSRPPRSNREINGRTGGRVEHRR